MIIYQSTCLIDDSDNFLTYPLYQYALAIPLIVKSVSDIIANNLRAYKKDNVESKLYFHPTFTAYIIGWIKYGVK
jgi:hypothetical protein